MFCGHQPFILAPKLCLRHKPLCHHCPLCSAGFVWRHWSRPLLSSAEGSAASGTRTLHQHRFRAQQLPRLSVGASAPCCRPATARPPGSPGRRCFAAAAGLGLGLLSSEKLAGGRVNTAHSGARGILLTGLSSGLGGAARARGGGPKARAAPPFPLPCLRPPAGCGASPAAKDSGQGCWRPSSPHPLPQSTHSPCVAPLQACSQSPLL